MSDNFPFNHFINIDKQNSDQISNNNNQIAKEILNKPETSLDVSDEFSTDELISINEEILSILKANINPKKYNAFFNNNFTIRSMNDDTITFSVTNSFIKKMVETHYLGNLEQAIYELMAQRYEVIISALGTKTATSSTHTPQSKSEFNSEISSMHQILNTTPVQKTTNANDLSFNIDTYTQTANEIIEEAKSQEIVHLNAKTYGSIDPNKTFKNFIVGPSNNMGHAFSLAVSKDPGNIYPQLYLHGNSGLGKTHLLHAICNFVKEANPAVRICMTTAGDFTKEMVIAIQSQQMAEFQRKYTDLVDILIIDDIHELANKKRTQEEFFQIFNQLQAKKKQLIFTSDKSPKDINGIEERIRTRLSSALLTDIQQPDLETRIAILKKKAIEKDIYISDDVITLIARCVRNNVRELEGKLIRLGAYSNLLNIDIDLEMAKEQLGLQEDYEEKILTVESITKAVASHFKIALGDVRGKSRKGEIVFARHIAMFMIHKILKKTLEEIGEYFDKRDHSTVIHAIDKIKAKVKGDAKTTQLVFEIESTL